MRMKSPQLETAGESAEAPQGLLKVYALARTGASSLAISAISAIWMHIPAQGPRKLVKYFNPGDAP